VTFLYGRKIKKNCPAPYITLRSTFLQLCRCTLWESYGKCFCNPEI